MKERSKLWRNVFYRVLFHYFMFLQQLEVIIKKTWMHSFASFNIISTKHSDTCNEWESCVCFRQNLSNKVIYKQSKLTIPIVWNGFPSFLTCFVNLCLLRTWQRAMFLRSVRWPPTTPMRLRLLMNFRLSHWTSNSLMLSFSQV